MVVGVAAADILMFVAGVDCNIFIIMYSYSIFDIYINLKILLIPLSAKYKTHLKVGLLAIKAR